MSIKEATIFEDDDKLRMAQMAFRFAQLGERGENIPEHELEDALYWVDVAIADIKGTQKYDIEAYSRTTAMSVIAHYVAAMLRGLDPYLTQSFITSYNRWLKAAAQERYENRPNSWPEYPMIEQRLRNREFGEFDPDAQTEEDF